jgi:hypothetical protein
MARTRISEFSATAADNTDIDNIDIAEGCAPSGINNAIRELMAQLKDMQTGASGDTFTLTTVNSTAVNATTVDATNLEVSNLKAKDGTAAASIADSTGVFTHATNAVFPAGAVGTPSITTAGDTNTGIFFPAADTIAFTEGGVESMRIDSSGNVGIGTSSPATRLEVSSASPILRVTDTATAVVGGTYGTLEWKSSDPSMPASGIAGKIDVYDDSAAFGDRGAMRFYTNNSTSLAERARIDSSGNWLVGTTSALSGTATGIFRGVAGASGSLQCEVNSTSTHFQIQFVNPNGLVGVISTIGSSTSYNTSSDYRLKENVQPMQNALATVAALKPVTYTWKSNGSAGQGFIAHELQEVVPDCVTGEKDAVDKDGKPQYQGVDTSFLVATLVAAIQELKAEVDALKGVA